MDSDHHIWRYWADSLHRWGLQAFVASILEAFGPLTIIGAQMVYLAQPLLRSIVPDNNLVALANLLENSEQSQAFITLLRE